MLNYRNFGEPLSANSLFGVFSPHHRRLSAPSLPLLKVLHYPISDNSNALSSERGSGVKSFVAKSSPLRLIGEVQKLQLGGVA